MSQAPLSQSQPARAAGLAGPVRMVLFAVMTVAIAGVGAFAGLQWQRHQSNLKADVSDSEAPSVVELALHYEEDVPGENAPTGVDASHPPGTSEEAVAEPSGHAAEPQPAEIHTGPVKSAEQSGGLILEHFDPLPEETIDPLVQLARGDELVLEGNYRLALHLYYQLARQASGLYEAHVRIRAGLCNETLGDLRQAQIEYRRVIELKPDANLVEAAILGQARVWSLSGRRELATATLYRTLIEGGCDSREQRASQFPHQLALLLSSRVESSTSGLDLEDQALNLRHLAKTPLTASPPKILEALLETPPRFSVPTPLPMGVTVTQRYSRSADETFLDVRLERLAILEIIRRVAAGSGETVRLTEEARKQLQEHTLQLHCRNLPLAVILDAVMQPYEVIWHTNEAGAILISTAGQSKADEITRYRMASAERALRLATLTAPEHPWAAISWLELGRLSHEAGQLSVAIRHTNQAIELAPRDEPMAIAWFNLAKLKLSQGDFAGAQQGFQRAVDLLSGHPLEPVAYLFLGRLQLEQDLARNSIGPLTRGLALSTGTRFEAVAASTLSSAYLMLGHFQRANQLLVDHKLAYSDAEDRDQAAFLACLVRFRSAPDQREQLREGATMIAALSNLQLSKTFGGHWPLLVGLAYRDTGMVPEEVRTFQYSLDTSYPFPLQSHMQTALVHDVGRPVTEARSASHGPGDGPMRFHAAIAEATLAFRDGDAQRALKLCEQVVNGRDVPEASRREALRLMGYVYQSQGDHQRAVHCFTGVAPSAATTPVSPLEVQKTTQGATR